MSQIHPTAIIGKDVTLEEGVCIGPYCVLEGEIQIGAGTTLNAGVHILGMVNIGKENKVHSHAVIGDLPQDLSYTEGIHSRVEIGDGNTIRENVTIHRGAAEGGVTRVTNHTFLMAGCHLGHDSRVGDHSILANNTLLGGHVDVGSRVFLGGGTVVHQFVKVGDLGMTQGNSGLSQDLPPYCVSHGINLLAGLNAIGMKRAGYSPELRKDIKSLFTLLFQSGVNLTDALKEASLQDWSPEALVLLKAVSHPSKKGVMRR